MTSVSFKTLAITAALTLASVSTALGQDSLPDFSTELLGGERKAPRSTSEPRSLIPAGLLYASFDTNGDYAASRDELALGIKRSFAAADKNANGSVSLVELAAWREAVLGSRDLLPGNTQFDKNFDSQIEPSEFETVLTDLFEGFDSNENGLLEFSEMTRSIPQGRRKDSREREQPSTAREPRQRRQRGY